MLAQMFRFGVIGVVGFGVDVGTLLLLVQSLHLNPLPARLASFVIAASVTFWLNQTFTFRLQARLSVRRWLYYLLTTAIGACTNVGIYRLWIHYNGIDPKQLVVGTGIGSLFAMSINYLVSSLWVFPAQQRVPVSTK